MKKTSILLTLISLISFAVFAQDENEAITSNNILDKSTFIGNGNIYTPPNAVKGNFYLLDNWFNSNLVYLSGKEDGAVKLSNININVKTNKFVTKLSKKSIYIFNDKYFDYVVIDGKKYKSIYNQATQDNRIYEIVETAKDFTLLKGTESYLVKGEIDPMQFKKVFDEYKIRSSFYVKKGNVISKFKLKKKSILSLLGNKDLVTEFAKKNKLSFKKVNDVKKIFKYYGTI
jgi:hypothetical protein